MNARNNGFLLLSCALAAALPLQAQIVSKADARQSTLAAAEAMLAIKQPSVPANAVDPFDSAAFSEAMGLTRPAAGEGQKTGPRSDREILVAIAAGLKPTGNFIIGGQQTLIFGQKRVKAGMPLTINFEGVEYTIEMTAIDRTSFTLRLNREELSRPIK